MPGNMDPMTTTTKSNLSLPAFSATVDDYLARSAHFDAYVQKLHDIRARRAELVVHRAAYYEALKWRVPSSSGPVPAAVDGQTIHLGWTRPAPRTTTTVTSAVAKKAAPRLWARARAVKPFVQVKNNALRVSVAAPDIHPKEKLDTLVAGYKGYAPELAELREGELAAVAALEAIADEAQWDRLPMSFADGWTVGLARVQYDSDTLREIDPQAWAALAVTVTTNPQPVLRIGAVDLETRTTMQAEGWDD